MYGLGHWEWEGRRPLKAAGWAQNWIAKTVLSRNKTVTIKTNEKSAKPFSIPFPNTIYHFSFRNRKIPEVNENGRKKRYSERDGTGFSRTVFIPTPIDYYSRLVVLAQRTMQLRVACMLAPSGRPWWCLGMKTETVIFEYRESFSKFYRNLGLNGNGNGYRKSGNGICRKIRNRKRKRFSHFRPFPEITVFIRYFTVGNKFGIFQKKY